MSSPVCISVYLVQHIDNPRRHEPRNVGVIVSDSKHVACILVDPSAKSLSRAHRAVIDLVSVDTTYSAWHAYWERNLAQGIDGLEEIISRQAPTFPIVLAGQIMDVPQEDLTALTQRFFDELVVPPIIAPEPREERPVERVLRVAGVASSPNFKRNYELPSVGLPSSLPLHFTYAWVNGHVAVADQILAHSGDTKVAAALWKFEHIEKSVRRVALVDHNIEFRPAPLRDYLRDIAHVIRVEDPDAATQLRYAFGIGK
jgi:hypothetical protein